MGWEVPVDHVFQRLPDKAAGDGCRADGVVTPYLPALVQVQDKDKDIMKGAAPFTQRVLLELSITTPNTRTDKTLGSRAAVIYRHKLAKYRFYYGGAIVPGVTWVGLIAESNGAWHRDSVLALRKFANAAMSSGGRVAATTMMANLRIAAATALMQTQMEIILNYERRLALPSSRCRRCLETVAECARLRALPGDAKRCPGEVLQDAQQEEEFLDINQEEMARYAEAAAADADAGGAAQDGE